MLETLFNCCCVKNSSEDWNDRSVDNDNEEEDGEGEASSDEDGYKRSRRASKHSRSKKSSSSGRSRPDRSAVAKSSNRHVSSRSRSTRYNSDSESPDDESDFDDSRSSGHKASKTNSRRSANTKTISYKEESECTDSDDLIPVNNGTEASGEGNGDDMVPIEEEEGEFIEKVLEHRMGSPGATGMKTAWYQVEDNGDPNDPNATEKELQFLVKWKGFSYIHCTWESKESLAEQKARGMKKVENYFKREEEISHW